MAGSRYREGVMAIGLLALGVAAFLGGAPVAIQQWGWRPVHVWALNIVAGVAVLIAIGRVTGQHLLTDERRRWSLSRLQLLTWTLLLLPSVWTMVVIKLLAGVEAPLALGMDENTFETQAAAGLAFPAMSQNLVALLGISHVTYLVGKVPNRVAAAAGASPSTLPTAEHTRRSIWPT